MSYSLEPTSFSQIASRCPKLVSVNLISTYELIDHIVDKLCGLSEMKCLSLPGDGLSSQAVKFVAENFLKLQTLHIRCTNIYEYSWIGGRVKFCDEDIKLIAKNCVNLKEISLTNRHNITDNSIVYIAKVCNGKLTKLCLDGCKRVSDQSIMALACNCPNLQYLSLSNLPDLENISILCIANYLSKLEYLYLCGNGNITNVFVAAVGKNCKLLQFIDVNHCTRLSGKFMVWYLLYIRSGLKIKFLDDIHKYGDYDMKKPPTKDQIQFAEEVDKLVKSYQPFFLRL
jgi:hypothetical protein